MRNTLFIYFLLIPLFAIAQVKEIKGIVLDSEGLELIGATVKIKGGQGGTITDFDGKFQIKAPSDATLEISYIGYESKSIAIKGQSFLKVVLKDDSQELEEVVVTGYGGKQLRSKVTSSIAKVDDKALNVGVYSNPAQALSGAVAGVRVIQSSGSPGATPQITLRGGTNYDGASAPLVIVDGQLRTSGLSDINPADIESMEVLKDAGATALYGARASNGVILITTKQGKKGTSSINFSAKMGLNFNRPLHDYLGAADYITAMRTAYVNTPWASISSLSAAQPMGTGNDINNPKMAWNLMYKSADNDYLLGKGWREMKDPIDPTKTLIYKETRPADYNLNNPALSQDYNVNMQGGNDKGAYYAGVGYNRSEGLPIETFYERYSFILNGNYKIRPWLTTTSNFNYNRSNWKNMPGSQSSEGNYFARIMSVPPTARYEDEDGNPLLGNNHSDGNQSFQVDAWQNFNQSDKFTMVQSLDVKLAKGLSLKASANWFYSENWAEAFTGDYQTTPGVWNTTRGSSAKFDRDFSQTYNAVLNYSGKFAQNHSLDAMLGGEYYDLFQYGMSASGQGAPTDDFWDLGLTVDEKGKRAINSYHDRYRILSAFGRINYDYKEKYLLSMVARHDGYSALLGDNRWGFFPGVSAGWLFGREDFAKEWMPWLSFGKARFSYGLNGNASSISSYTLQGSYVAAQYAGNVGYWIGTLPNPSLRWEKTRTAEVGFDLSFFHNRLNTNFTFYDRLTSDKHADFALPSTTGFSSVKSNNGSYLNRGFELEVSGDIIRAKDFSWNAKFNIAYNRNKIVSLPDNGLQNNMQKATQIYKGPGSDETIYVGGYQQGQEPGVLIGYEAVGIYKTIDDIPGDLIVTSGNAKGAIQYGPDAWAKLSDAEKKKRIELQPGDVQWKDINEDGKIDSYDRVVMGNTTPRFTGGFNTTVSWKGLSLYARFDFALDYYIYDSTTPWMLGNMQGTYNTTKDYFNTYTADNPNAKYPRYVWADQLGTANYYRTSTLFAYKGNYLAARELALSYTLPKAWLKKASFENVTLSVIGQNLGYLTSEKDLVSPEVSGGQGYALPTSVVFGINVTL